MQICVGSNRVTEHRSAEEILKDSDHSFCILTSPEPRKAKINFQLCA